MGSAGSGNDWVRHWTALTAAREGEDAGDPIAHSADLAACLAEEAAALAASGTAEADDQPPTAALLRLARALAAEMPPDRPDEPGGRCGSPPSSGDPTRFLAALEEAAHAVYHCRRVQHPRGRCWFSASGPESGLCGEVLTAAHTMRPPRTSVPG